MTIGRLNRLLKKSRPTPTNEEAHASPHLGGGRAEVNSVSTAEADNLNPLDVLPHRLSPSPPHS